MSRVTFEGQKFKRTVVMPHAFDTYVNLTQTWRGQSLRRFFQRIAKSDQRKHPTRPVVNGLLNADVLFAMRLTEIELMLNREIDIDVEKALAPRMEEVDTNDWLYQIFQKPLSQLNKRESRIKILLLLVLRADTARRRKGMDSKIKKSEKSISQIKDLIEALRVKEKRYTARMAKMRRQMREDGIGEYHDPDEDVVELRLPYDLDFYENPRWLGKPRRETDHGDHDGHQEEYHEEHEYVSSSDEGMDVDSDVPQPEPSSIHHASPSDELMGQPIVGIPSEVEMDALVWSNSTQEIPFPAYQRRGGYAN
ncbi:hypothetical protein BDN72DRAFT_881265 [Pluteus cervinus]|uniref:Uncharacterized protein n=1 Tax=Pluteus cervinus TaxID=181527 RepID=A0ACD3AH48_9AGAR|nr:hypothetical protein BDN72DRAFT_881265 [Pluteus cervinus]